MPAAGGFRDLGLAGADLCENLPVLLDRLGVAAGDVACINWVILCGMAKAKYYLLTCDPVYGEEAERMGLVSLCTEDDELEAKSLEVAEKRVGPQPE